MLSNKQYTSKIIKRKRRGTKGQEVVFGGL
jgi:hypothetical protein